MSEANNRPIPDLLDRATGALRDAPVPAGPPADLTAATVAAINNRLAGTVPSDRARQQRRRRIMRYVGYGTATAAAVALTTAVGVLWLGGGSAAARVQKALDNAAKAKSVRLVWTREFEGKTEPLMTVHIQDGRSRWEGRTRDKDITIVFDATARRGLRLDHKAKTAIQETLDAKGLDGVAKQHEVFFDPLKVMHDTKDMTVKELDGEKLDGRPIKVYSVAHPGNDEHAAMTAILWIDEKTNLPARLKLLEDSVVTEGREKPWPKADTVITFEDWNKEFDAKLFKQDVPDGYRVVEKSPDGGPVLPVRLFQAVLEKAEKAKSVRVKASTEMDGKWVDIQTITREGDRVRVERPRQTLILNLETLELLTLDPVAKTARRSKLAAQEAKLVAGVMGGLDTIKAQLADGDDQAVKELGPDKLDGKKATKYEVKSQKPELTWTVWVDPKTNLPLRIESTGGQNGQGGFRLDFEKWNEEFDAKLFKQDVPEGYKLVEQPEKK